ncbi:MAG: M20/M25/M40 family metallo-hydrolase, partial [Bacteroidota bacterium]
MWKKILLFVFAALVALVSFLYYNAITLTSVQIGNKAPSKLPEVSKEAVSHLSRAIRFPTISYDDRRQIVDSNFVQLKAYIKLTYPLTDSLLENIGLPNHSLLYYWPGQDQKLKPALIMAHLDVVPVSEVKPANWYTFQDEQQIWSQPPFSGKVAGGYIWGRGALDDKLNVFAMLEATETLLATGFRPKRSLYLFFGHDEEIGGAEGAQVAADYLKNESVELEFVLDEGLFILEGLMPGVAK